MNKITQQLCTYVGIKGCTEKTNRDCTGGKKTAGKEKFHRKEKHKERTVGISEMFSITFHKTVWWFFRFAII